ncbi:hypothetical protein B0T10DRAFT_143630 [Thelonectria olida]|uniref:Uncharacterized protein n=1 Tax=Thelonectria olida TaxID=1576542 RepID=A0A9P8VWQ8_9HYPO|nr:hypothetical protein B0T10DRAFT_143630 [Thelonectria olida]
MQLRSALVVASVATVAAATGLKRELPVTVPILVRQVTGAEYECHASCGYAILNAEADGYCTDQDWLDDLSGCLECALVYSIWQWYGTQVAAAAEACGLDATPSPATTEAATASSTQVAPTTTFSEATSTSQSEQSEVATTETQPQVTTADDQESQTAQTTTDVQESQTDQTTTNQTTRAEPAFGGSTASVPTQDATTEKTPEQTATAGSQTETASDENAPSITESAGEVESSASLITGSMTASTPGSENYDTSASATGGSYLTANSSYVSQFSGVAAGTGAATTVLTSVTPGANSPTGDSSDGSDSSSATSVPSSVVAAGASKTWLSGFVAIGAMVFAGVNLV